MYEYEITFSFLQEGKRITDTDTFWGDGAQEAVNECRHTYKREFSLQAGRIETVCNEWAEILTDWE